MESDKWVKNVMLCVIYLWLQKKLGKGQGVQFFSNQNLNSFWTGSKERTSLFALNWVLFIK